MSRPAETIVKYYIRGVRFFKRLTGFDNSRRVIFLHIPKCAGSSVNNHFKSNFGGKKSGRVVYLDSTEPKSQSKEMIKKAKSAKYVGGHFGYRLLGYLEPENAITFTVLRHPFDRLWSLYQYIVDHDQTEKSVLNELIAKTKPLSFVEFCLSDDPVIRSFADNTMTRTLSHDYYPYRNSTEEDLLSAKENLKSFDHVILTKDLTKSFHMLAKISKTHFISEKYTLNRNQAKKKKTCPMTLEDFISDTKLCNLIKYDLELYNFAETLNDNLMSKVNN